MLAEQDVVRQPEGSAIGPGHHFSAGVAIRLPGLGLPFGF